MAKERAAFFDLDGTLSARYISMDFMEYLARRGVYSNGSYDAQLDLEKRYREGQVSYESWCLGWGKLWAEGMSGVGEDIVGKDAAAFFEGFRRNIYPESYGIVKAVKARGYVPMLVSTAAYEVSSLAATALGIHEVYATRLRFVSGKCSGILESMFAPGDKARTLDRLAGRVDLSASMSFGDSAPDVEMLEKVGKPVSLNGKPGLVSIAASRKWQILTKENAASVIAGASAVLR